MQRQDIGIGMTDRAQVQALIGPVESYMLLILARLVVQALEQLQCLDSIDGPIDVDSRTVEDLLHGTFRQTLVLALEQANPILIRVLERLIAGIEQSGPRLRIGDGLERLIELEASDGVGKHRRRRATGLHQAQHIVVDRADPGDLRQYLVTEGSKRCANASHQLHTRRHGHRRRTGRGLGRRSGMRFAPRFPRLVQRSGDFFFALECRHRTDQRKRIEQAEHRARHALGALLRCFTVDGLIEAITGVDQPGQYQDAFASRNEQCQWPQPVDPLHERFHHRAQVVAIDLGIVADGFDAGHGSLLHGQHQLRERIGIGRRTLKVYVVLRVPETIVVEEPRVLFQPVFLRVHRHAVQRRQHARMESAVFTIVLRKMRDQRLPCRDNPALGHDPLAQLRPVGELMQG
ncbi:hypothetical protein D3C76_524240 [compost metagenome]